MARVSPGGVGDGLPALPSGEPVLARWFAIAFVGLVVVGLAVTAWAVASIRSTDLSPAARRPPGDTVVTHERGQAALAQDTTQEPGVGCAPGVVLVGDEGARSTARRALSTVCGLLGREPDALAAADAGLRRLSREGGRIRIAVFELTGLDSSTRIEDGVPVVELNAKFQFENATLAAPALLHELAHLGFGAWPQAPVGVDDELLALDVQVHGCDALVLPDDPPRGCRDAQEVLDADDPASELVEAGYVR